jgi:hypothetical protein
MGHPVIPVINFVGLSLSQDLSFFSSFCPFGKEHNKYYVILEIV